MQKVRGRLLSQFWEKPITDEQTNERRNERTNEPTRMKLQDLSSEIDRSKKVNTKDVNTVNISMRVPAINEMIL